MGTEAAVDEAMEVDASSEVKAPSVMKVGGTNDDGDVAPGPEVKEVANDEGPKCWITRRDYDAILAMTRDSPRVETGGDLWGEWVKGDCKVKAVTGPGKRARKFATAFFQDEDYMDAAGRLLHGHALHIGTWHSHHQLGLPYPSGGDNRTFAIAMEEHERPRFIAFIAAIEAGRPVVRPFFYHRSAQGHVEMATGVFKHVDDAKFRDFSAELEEMARTGAAAPKAELSEAASWINEGTTSKTLAAIIQEFDRPPFKKLSVRFVNAEFVINFQASAAPNAALVLTSDLATSKSATLYMPKTHTREPEAIPLNLKKFSFDAMPAAIRKTVANKLGLTIAS